MSNYDASIRFGTYREGYDAAVKAAAAGPWQPVPPTKEDRYLVRWEDGSWGTAYWFDGKWMWDCRLSTSLDPIAFAEINTEEPK